MRPTFGWATLTSAVGRQQRTTLLQMPYKGYANFLLFAFLHRGLFMAGLYPRPKPRNRCNKFITIEGACRSALVRFWPRLCENAEKFWSPGMARHRNEGKSLNSGAPLHNALLRNQKQDRRPTEFRKSTLLHSLGRVRTLPRPADRYIISYPEGCIN